MAVVFARDCSRWSWAPYGAVVPSSSQRWIATATSILAND
jgi:hypothetical protein